MKQKLLNLNLLVFILVSVQSFGQELATDRASLSFRKPTGEPMATLININNISMWAQADGSNRNVIYPRGTATVVYGDGILWGGFVKDGHNPELRVGGQRWIPGTVPGRILSKGIAEDPSDPDVRIWRIRPDGQTADLTQDAAEFFNVSVDSVTQEQIETVRAQYEKDWKEWPWQKGAPFYDSNGNGIMDRNEEPGLAHADQVVWFVANDLDSVVTTNFFRSPPIGLEMQVTLWAYNRTGSRLNDAFQHIIFKRVRLIYKGRADTPDAARIDSMFIGQVVDSDVGYYGDDFAGCDTLLQLGYGYNSKSTDIEFQKFNLSAPAIGYTLIQGPIVASNTPLDYANFDFGKRSGFINLPMTSFWQKATGTAIRIDVYAFKMYKAMNGFLPLMEGEEPFYDCNGNPTRFMVSGDPVKGTGCIDGMRHVHPGFPGDRSFQMSSGPFTMALGDTQEVIIAMVGGSGSGSLASVSVMKHYVKWARFYAQSVFVSGLQDVVSGELLEEEVLPQDFRLYQNYPNPFNAETEIRYDLPLQKDVRLTIYNIMGQVVKVLVNDTQEAGNYVFQWNGMDVRGEKVPSGIYLYRIEAGHWVLTKKMILLR